MPLRRWIDRLNFAINGVLHAARTERHLRYHLYSAVAILVISFVFGLSQIEFITVVILVSLVLLAEMINTAIEHTVNLLSPERRDEAKYAKDIAAGAVLVTAFTSAVIGFIILYPHAKRSFTEGIRLVKYAPEDIVVVSLVIVLLSVILTKAHFGKGKPLQGGLPSGHAAISFAVWVSVSFVTRSFIASVLSFLLATLIAQSRVAVKAHNALEVIAGALLGSLITFLLFYVFR